MPFMNYFQIEDCTKILYVLRMRNIKMLLSYYLFEVPTILKEENSNCNDCNEINQA